MRAKRFIWTVALLFLVTVVLIGYKDVVAESVATPHQAAIGTAFTYQGRLTDNGAAANGSYDLRFELYDAQSGGTQIGSTVAKSGVTVTDGYFTVHLDFGLDVFNGEARYLEISVRPAGSGAYTSLTPRQALTPAPYALHAGAAEQAPWSGLSGMPADFADGVDNVGEGGVMTIETGPGLTSTGTETVTLGVDFAGSGAANTVARSDHAHDSLVPTGAIIMWSGTLDAIPTGWALCDGTNGTPDLTEKFIFSVSAGEDPGTEGGGVSHSHTVDPHSHYINPPSTNTSTNGSHSHSMGHSGYESAAACGGPFEPPCDDRVAPDYHRHTVYSSGSHYHSVDIGGFNSFTAGATTADSNHLPPYYELAFVMKLPQE